MTEKKSLTVQDRHSSGNLSSCVEQGEQVNCTGIEWGFTEAKQKPDCKGSMVVVDPSSSCRYTCPCPENQRPVTWDEPVPKVTHIIQHDIQMEGRTLLVDMSMFEGI